MWLTVRWIVWELSGLRAIWEKFHPPEPGDERSKPVTIVFWVIGFYLAFFGLVSNRYENKVDNINTRATALVSQLIAVQNPDIKRELAYNQIPIVQRMECPVEPVFWNPISTIQSVMGTPGIHHPSADMLRIPLINIMESESDNLHGIVLLRGYASNVKLFDADLSGADLSGTDLSGANLIEADFTDARLVKTTLAGATLVDGDLNGADLRGADLSGADLNGTNLSGTRLNGTNLFNADLIDATLIGADLINADLRNTDLSGANMIVANLSGADLSGADLSDADLNGVTFAGTNLSGANLSGVDLSWALKLTADQLSQATTLYGAIMDVILKTELEKKHPELFKLPGDM